MKAFLHNLLESQCKERVGIMTYENKLYIYETTRFRIHEFYHTVFRAIMTKSVLQIEHKFLKKKHKS